VEVINSLSAGAIEFVNVAVNDRDAAESKLVVVIDPVVAVAGTTVRITSPFPAAADPASAVIVIPGIRTPELNV
jgi:hypothetical protein